MSTGNAICLVVGLLLFLSNNLAAWFIGGILVLTALDLMAPILFFGSCLIIVFLIIAVASRLLGL